MRRAVEQICDRCQLDPVQAKHRTTARGRPCLRLSGEMPQREFERTMGRLLGIDDNGLLAKAPADLEPRPEVIGLTRRARAKGVKVAALSNSWGTGDYDPYAGSGLRRCT